MRNLLGTQISAIVNEAITNYSSLEKINNLELSSLEKARLIKSISAIKSIVDGKCIQSCDTCNHYQYVVGFGNSDRGLDYCKSEKCSEHRRPCFRGNVTNCPCYELNESSLI